MEAKVILNNGRPLLTIDGKPTAPVIYGLSDIPGSDSNTHQAWRNIRNFSKAGIKIVECDTGLHLGWHKTSGFDTAALKSEILSVLDADKTVAVIVRLHLNPPYWWLRDNPDEQCVYRTPDGDREGIDDGEYDRLIKDDFSKHLRCSMASEKWKKEAGELLAVFCKEVENEIPNLIGIQVAYGIYGEWHQWGIDVGKPMKARFARYLRDRYRTLAELRSAYGKDAEYENVTYTPEKFIAGDDGDFRDPIKSRRIIDSQMCQQTVTPETIAYFCEIVKKSFKKNILTGTFYCYYFNKPYDKDTNIGHLMPEIIFENKKFIDFVSGPFPYMDNRKPDEVPLQRGLLESCSLNGILWLTEMDEHPVGTEKRKGGEIGKRAETVAQLRRHVFGPLTAGHGLWYYDHRIVPWLIAPDSKNASAGSIYRKNGWWDTAFLMNEISSIQRIAASYCTRPYQHAADVLCVFDTRSAFHCVNYAGPKYSVLKSLIKTGVAIDNVYLFDFDKVDLSRYKLVVFMNTYLLTEKTRETVTEKLKNKTVAWLYASGYSDGNMLSAEHIAKTVGMDVYKTKEKKVSIITAYDESFTWEKADAPTPTFAIRDGEPLAYYDDKSTAAARKANVWYFAYPIITEKQAKDLVKASGAHVYSDGDAVYAGAGLLVINSPQGGKKTVRFPDGKTADCDFDGITTAVFDVETHKRLL